MATGAERDVSARDARMERQEAVDAWVSRCVTPLGGSAHGRPDAWFLGPKAENVAVLRDLVVKALDDHAAYRLAFHREDPERITPRVKGSSEYQAGIAQLTDETSNLLRCLRGSVPFFSMRYQGHMLWDQALPAMVGYFAAMLYNQNNVAAEASPVTTRMEIEVGDELCKMLGYGERDGVSPWGHITAGGSVANIESLWAARNAKFFAFALRSALKGDVRMENAKALEVRRLDGTSEQLVNLDAWTCLNLRIDDVIALPKSIEERFGISVETTKAALAEHALENRGLVDFYSRLRAEDPTIGLPIVLAPVTRHYSWPKAMTLLGLGDAKLETIGVDFDARMKIDELKRRLQQARLKRIPVIAVIVVIGSTEESAVDPLHQVLELRETCRRDGFDFAVHCDAAWGGYFNATLRESGGRDVSPDLVRTLPAHELPMSPYVIEQYQALREADSVTVDPHKAGYVPYPAGALCYRNSKMRDLVSLKAPVVYHHAAEATVGIYGIEGSKPGAAAAAVYLAHKVIPANRSGYGRILRECLWVSKRTFCRLATMDLDSSRLRIVFLQRLPSEREGKDPSQVLEEKKRIRADFVDMSDEDLEKHLEDPEKKSFFMKLGSDQVILSYAFNFVRDGRLNTDLAKANELNFKIYQTCSLSSDEEELMSKRLFITSSEFHPATYGREFTDEFCRRLGVTPQPNVAVNFLITTTMDPWTTELDPKERATLSREGEAVPRDFLAEIEASLRSAAERALEQLDRQ